MINFDYVIKEETKEHNPNWPGIPDHPYRILITGDSGSEKTNSLSNLINQQPDIDKIYQSLINKRKSAELKHFNDSEAFMEYSNDMKDIYKNIEEYQPK